MKFISTVMCFLFILDINAVDFERIQYGKDHTKYSKKELTKRIWKLERAVWQLQQKVFQLETSPKHKYKKTKNWICTIKAMGETYTGVSNSQALAKSKVFKNCKKGRKGDGFFCKNPSCEKL